MILASLILLSVIATTTFGAIFTDKKLGELTKSIDGAIPSDSESTEAMLSGAGKIEDEYLAIKKYLILFVHDNDMLKIEEQIEDVKSAAATGELSDLITSKNRLILHIEQLRRLSEFSSEAIF